MEYQITEEGLNELIEKHSNIQECSPDALAMMYKAREAYYVENGVAYIAVYGPLVRNASEYMKLTGVTDYDQISEELEQAANDLMVNQVVMVFNSPGGESIGSEEVANMVSTFPKPVIGLVEGICASAAYKIASACFFVVSTISSEVGSIGSIIVIENSKKMANGAGVKRDIFVNDGATYKSIGQDFGDTTPEQKEYLQEKINKSGKRFQDTVKTNRPEVSEQCFTAAMFTATDAVMVGLIDGIINE